MNLESSKLSATNYIGKKTVCIFLDPNFKIRDKKFNYYQIIEVLS